MDRLTMTIDKNRLIDAIRKGTKTDSVLVSPLDTDQSKKDSIQSITKDVPTITRRKTVLLLRVEL
jgi:hypothetical protein